MRSLQARGSKIMKKLITLSAFLVLGTTAYSQLYIGAGPAYYFSEATTTATALGGGGGKDRYDGLGGIGHIGYKVPDNGWHIEFEFQYFEPSSTFRTTASGQDVQALTGTNLGNGDYVTKIDGDNYSYMGNVYYNILDSMETDWRIIFGGGIGFTNLKQTVRVNGPAGQVRDSDDKWLFTWQLMSGIGWQPLDHLRFDLTYRYTDPKNGNFNIFNNRMTVKDYSFQSVALSVTLSL